MKLVKKIIIIIVAIAISFVFYKFFFTTGEKTESKNYTITSVEKKVGGGYFESTGVVTPKEQKGVFVDKPLKVKEVLVHEGDYVEKDQVVITFDESSRNKLKRMLEAKRIARNTVARNLKVEQELIKLGGSSKNKILDFQDELRRSSLEISDMEEDLEKTASEIKSPVSGTITKLTAQENYLVDTTKPLFEIADLSDLKILLGVVEYNIQFVKLDQEVILKPEIFEGTRTFKGKVTKISKLSYVSQSTGENIVEVEVTPSEVIPLVTSGFKVYGGINISSDKEKLFIPKTSLLHDNEGYYVFKVENNRAIKTRVEIENVSGGEIPLISGLNENDNIIYNPSETIKEGEEIKGGK